MPSLSSERVLIIAAALFVIAVFLLAVFSGGGGSQGSTSGTPSATPQGSVTPLLRPVYEFNGSNVSISEKTGGDVKNGFFEEVSVASEGAKKAVFSLLDVLPSSLSEGAGFDLLSGQKPVSTEFLSLNPLIRLSELALDVGEGFSSRFSSPRFAEEFPLHLFADAGLSEKQKTGLTALGRKIAGLRLGERDARVLERKLNAGYSEYKKAGKPFDEFVSAADAFVGEADDARKAGRKIEALAFPSPLPFPSSSSWSESFPSLPDEILVGVSEAEPSNSTVFPIQSRRFLGTLLVKFEGDAAEYADAETGFSGGEYNLSVSADLSDAELEDCLFPFDEISGYADFMFVSVPGVVKRVPLRIEVSHFNMCKDLEENDLVSADGTFGAEAVKTAEDAAAVGKLTENFFGTDAIWAWPADGKIISVFGDCRDGCTRPHQGIDIQAPEGSPVYAIDDGLVEYARDYTSYATKEGSICGKYARIRLASGKTTVYCHLSEVSVRAGQAVKKCQEIGKMGRTGKNVKTVHLHFQIGAPGNWVDPLPLLGKKADYCVAQAT